MNTGYCLNSLYAYRSALQKRNMDTLVELLEEGKRRKEQVDG